MGNKLKPVDPFYLSAAWKQKRREVLAQHPSCQCCLAASTHVDHIKPRRLFPELALANFNLRALCVHCHNARSARQYGGSAEGFAADGTPLDKSHPWHAGEGARVQGGELKSWQVPVVRAAMESVGEETEEEQAAAASQRRVAEQANKKRREADETLGPEAAATMLGLPKPSKGT